MVDDGTQVFGQVAVFLVIGLLLWLLLIRPAQRNQRAMIALQESVQPGQRVILTSGILGTARDVSADRFEIEIAPGVTVQVAKGAVASVLADEPSDPDSAPQ